MFLGIEKERSCFEITSRFPGRMLDDARVNRLREIRSMAKKTEFGTKNNVRDLQAEYGKMPPQAVDLEEAVLGALMLERDAFSIVGDF